MARAGPDPDVRRKGAPVDGGGAASGRRLPRHRRAPARRTRVDLLQVALFGCILTYVWRLQDLYPVLATVRLPILVSLAAIGAFIMDRDRRRSLSSIKHPITTLIGVFLGLAVLSVPTSIYDGQSFRFIVEDLSKTILITVILAASVRAFADVRRYAAAMVVGCAIYALFVHVYIPIGEGGRLGDLLYYDANDLGMVLVSTIPLALFFVIRGHRLLQRVMAVLALALFIIVIVKTGSRGAFLGLVAVSAYLLFAFRSVSKGLRMVAVAGAFIGLLVFGGEQYWSLIGTLANPQQDYNWSGQSEGGRLETWRRGLGYMWDRPVTGLGINNFGVAEGTLSELADRQQYGIGLKWGTAHNSFVQVGAEIGVFGLIVFVLLIGHAYRAARNVGPAPPRGARASDERMMGEAMAGSVVGYVVTAFFLSQGYAAYALILYGMIVGLSKVGAAQGSPVRAPRRRNRGARMRPAGAYGGTIAGR